MAELSDSDKRALMGADYKREEARRDAELGITDLTRDAQARENSESNITMAATGIGIVAFLIGLGNYFSRGTPYNPTLVGGCLVVVIASALAVGFMRYRKRNG